MKSQIYSHFKQNYMFMGACWQASPLLPLAQFTRKPYYINKTPSKFAKPWQPLK